MMRRSASIWPKARGSPPVAMIRRRGKFNLIHSPADPDQLFDLERDPGERDNLADSPACATLIADFRAEVGKRWDFAKLDVQSPR